MELDRWNKEQIKEALSEKNLYYFREHNGRDPVDDEELIMYYIDHGGSEDFAKNHEGEKPEKPKPKTSA